MTTWIKTSRKILLNGWMQNGWMFPEEMARAWVLRCAVSPRSSQATGESITLNYELTSFHCGAFGRKGPEQWLWSKCMCVRVCFSFVELGPWCFKRMQIIFAVALYQSKAKAHIMTLVWWILHTALSRLW